MPTRSPVPRIPGRLAALGFLLLVTCPAGAQSSPTGPTTSPRVYEGAVVYPAPEGRVFYYFKYVQDSVLVIGEGIGGDPRVALPHQSFVALLRSLHSMGALRDTVALRYALEAQFAPPAPDDLAVSFQAPVVTVLTALGLVLALVAVGVLYRRARRERAARARERAFRLGLTEAREAERAHFARELHDGPLQDLCAVQLALAALDGDDDEAPAPAARAAVKAVIADLRGLCDRLRPPALDAFGLPTALEALAQRVARQHTDLHVTCHVGADPDAPALSPDHQLALFRIAQEALTNAVRHARAARVELAFSLTPSGVRLCVDDDGAGPPVRDALDYAREGHYGLLGMRERADLLGAGLAVERSPLGGTRIVVTRSNDAAARAERPPQRPTIPRRRRSLRRRSAPAL